MSEIWISRLRDGDVILVLLGDLTQLGWPGMFSRSYEEQRRTRQESLRHVFHRVRRLNSNEAANE